MSFWSKVLQHSANARAHVERARDPDTHLPYPKPKAPNWKIGVVSWLTRTAWANRQWLKITSAVSGSLSVWLASKGAGEHGEAIALGVVATLNFFFEIAVSKLAAAAGKVDLPPQPASEVIPERPEYFNPPVSSLTNTDAMSNNPVFSPRELADQLEAKRLAAAPIAPLPRMTGEETERRINLDQKPAARPLGKKGQPVIVRTFSGEIGSTPVVVHGTLEGEMDQWVLIRLDEQQTPSLFDRSKSEFYLLAE